MNDIAACDNDYCPARLECLRWQIGTKKDTQQWYSNFAPKYGKDRCEFYVNRKYYKLTN